MKNLSIFLVLLLFLSLTACSTSQESLTATPLPPVTVQPAVSTPTVEPPPPTVAVTEAAQPAPQATSRGDSLVASDPASVLVGNGSPVLLEFFRFT